MGESCDMVVSQIPICRYLTYSQLTTTETLGGSSPITPVDGRTHNARCPHTMAGAVGVS